MGFWGSIGSAIGSAISSVGRAISSGISAVGRGLSSFASAAVGIVGSLASKAANFIGMVSTLPLGPLGPVLGPIVGQLIVRVAVKAIVALAKSLGIIKEKDKPEEIGYRIEEAQQHEDWKRQEDFKSFSDYYAYLKQQIPDDKIDLKRLEENRNRYVLLGLMELTRGLEENFQIDIPESFLFEIGRGRMELNEIRSFIEAFKSLEYGSVLASEYLKGQLSRDESRQIETALLNGMKKYYPLKSDDELYERLGVMRAASRNDEKLLDVYEDKLTKENFERIEKAGKIPEDL